MYRVKPINKIVTDNNMLLNIHLGHRRQYRVRVISALDDNMTTGDA